MYKLFSKIFEEHGSVIKPPNFEMVKRSYQRDILNIVNYYNSRVYAVKSNHILCRLLNSSGVPFQYELDRFTEAATARSPYVAKLFNFTSEITNGIVFNGVFYGEDVQEIIIYNEEYFNPYDAFKNWRNIKAVKVLDHPISDLGLLLPNGFRNSTAKGLAVITINLPLLLVQYRGFVIEQYNKMQNGSDSLLAISHFIHMYVLPSMIESHAEIVIINRLINLYYGAPMSQKLKKHPFPIVDYSDRLDNTLKEVLKHISDTSMPYYTSLKNIPSFFSVDAQVALQMPDLAKTKQVWWALFLSRMKVMQFLIDEGGSKGIAANNAYINKLKLDVKRLLDDNVSFSRLPSDMYFDINEEMLEMLRI